MKFRELGLTLDQELSAQAADVRFVDLVVLRNILYGTTKTDFGLMTLAWCDAGICYLGFEEKRTLEQVIIFFPDAELNADQKNIGNVAQKVMASWNNDEKINLVVRGTPFQKSVWESLLHIPAGHVVTYGAVARYIGKPKAVRAVGSAVGANPVSILIPCHRVIQGNGSLKNYGWGNAVKERLLREESRLAGNL
jgi:AraC family transcriptional regulator of adaptative response/methylated-DNA-[protein]-cysteine methyltransferase